MSDPFALSLQVEAVLLKSKHALEAMRKDLQKNSAKEMHTIETTRSLYSDRKDLQTPPLWDNDLMKLYTKNLIDSFISQTNQPPLVSNVSQNIAKTDKSILVKETDLQSTPTEEKINQHESSPDWFKADWKPVKRPTDNKIKKPNTPRTTRTTRLRAELSRQDIRKYLGEKHPARQTTKKKSINKNAKKCENKIAKTNSTQLFRFVGGSQWQKKSFFDTHRDISIEYDASDSMFPQRRLKTSAEKLADRRNACAHKTEKPKTPNLAASEGLNKLMPNKNSVASPLRCEQSIRLNKFNYIDETKSATWHEVLLHKNAKSKIYKISFDQQLTKYIDGAALSVDGEVEEKLTNAKNKSIATKKFIDLGDNVLAVKEPSRLSTKKLSVKNLPILYIKGEYRIQKNFSIDIQPKTAQSENTASEDFQPRNVKVEEMVHTEVENRLQPQSVAKEDERNGSAKKTKDVINEAISRVDLLSERSKSKSCSQSQASLPKDNRPNTQHETTQQKQSVEESVEDEICRQLERKKSFVDPALLTEDLLQNYPLSDTDSLEGYSISDYRESAFESSSQTDDQKLKSKEITPEFNMKETNVPQIKDAKERKISPKSTHLIRAKEITVPNTGRQHQPEVAVQKSDFDLKLSTSSDSIKISDNHRLPAVQSKTDNISQGSEFPSERFNAGVDAASAKANPLLNTQLVAFKDKIDEKNPSTLAKDEAKSSIDFLKESIEQIYSKQSERFEKFKICQMETKKDAMLDRHIDTKIDDFTDASSKLAVSEAEQKTPNQNSPIRPTKTVESKSKHDENQLVLAAGETFIIQHNDRDTNKLNSTSTHASKEYDNALSNSLLRKQNACNTLVPKEPGPTASTNFDTVVTSERPQSIYAQLNVEHIHCVYGRPSQTPHTNAACQTDFQVNKMDEKTHESGDTKVETNYSVISNYRSDNKSDFIEVRKVSDQTDIARRSLLKASTKGKQKKAKPPEIQRAVKSFLRSLSIEPTTVLPQPKYCEPIKCCHVINSGCCNFSNLLPSLSSTSNDLSTSSAVEQAIKSKQKPTAAVDKNEPVQCSKLQKGSTFIIDDDDDDETDSIWNSTESTSSHNATDAEQQTHCDNASELSRQISEELRALGIKKTDSAANGDDTSSCSSVCSSSLSKVYNKMAKEVRVRDKKLRVSAKQNAATNSLLSEGEVPSLGEV